MLINAMIPARMGSTRLKQKNLALINNKPMISYVINAAKKSGAFDSIHINSESKAFEEIASVLDVSFYHREDELGNSSAKSDDVVYDFIRGVPGDITVWVNSISPLQSAQELKSIISYFVEQELDSLITVRDEQVHCDYDGEPLNYSHQGKFAQTQDLKPVSRFVYSVMMWKNSVFLKEYEEKGSALMCGKFGTYPVSKESSLIVKTEEDLRLIQDIVFGRESNKDWKLEYDKAAK
jgi:CMP-N-acetylneuraminic acid synthetase